MLNCRAVRLGLLQQLEGTIMSTSFLGWNGLTAASMIGAVGRTSLDARRPGA